MIKETKVLSKDYKFPHLYLDDLKSIEESLIKNSMLKIPTLEISTEEYSCDSIQELASRKITNIKRLKMVSLSPNTHINFSDHDATLVVWSDDVASRGLFAKLDEIILRTERGGVILLNKILFFSKLIIFVPFILAPLGVLLDNNFEAHVKIVIVPIIISLIITVLIIRLFEFYLKHLPVSKIELIERKEELNFFQRNKDQILLILLTNTLTGLISWTIGYFARSGF